ncbi:transcription factor ABORTED MICROSPORES isoform X1 [Ricinus communis]|uniref:transcription factor ABORTED MICROSPORES isoform X1 n=2 Tax=Ricinus communis TaxID=3988 RepID=UPI00201A2DF2|nr:transcription factor ABORTED MICROSPORES isoform X1 [Ricinus communis]XP_048233584.1 transcription factor ABORTED MICROSPORES isoform X1 [Ricinus communis]
MCFLWATEGSYHSSLFFHAFPEGLEKAAINRIFLTLPSRNEGGEILFPFRRDQEIGSSRKKNVRFEIHRFPDWMDCCCGGTENTQVNGGEELQFPVSSVLTCRDIIFQHPRTKYCDLLARLPSSMPLESGIHAQALISNESRWINFSNNSDLNGTVGTRALIPVPGGLLELFVTKQVSEDQHAIDIVTTQCTILMKQEAMISSTNIDTGFVVNMKMIGEEQSKAYLADHDNMEEKDHTNKNQFQQAPNKNLNLPYDISADRIRLCSPPMNFLQQFHYSNDRDNKTKSNDHIFFEEAATNSSNGLQDQMDAAALHKIMMMTTNTENMHMKFMGPSSGKKEQQANNDNDSIKHENGISDSVSDCSNQMDDENDAKYRRRTGRGPPAKDLKAERRRRKMLNDRLYDLRALVPKISNLNKVSILGDAIEFVKELQKQAKELENELEEHSDDDQGVKNGIHNNIPQETLNQDGGIVNGFHVGSSEVVSCSKLNHKSETSHDKGQQMEVQVDVAQIDGNEFFVKVFCEHKAGRFMKLMEALDCLGLEVTNANVTSFRGLVSNVFKVEKKDSEMVQADYVRESLLELTRDAPSGWPEMAKT